MQQLLHRGAAVTQHRTDEVLDASWDDLRSFLACARYKSFRNAAEELGATAAYLDLWILRSYGLAIDVDHCQTRLWPIGQRLFNPFFAVP